MQIRRSFIHTFALLQQSFFFLSCVISLPSSSLLSLYRPDYCLQQHRRRRRRRRRRRCRRYRRRRYSYRRLRFSFFPSRSHIHE